MQDGDERDALKTEELTEVIRGIRERVRARHPAGSAAGIPIPDLMPVVHARDAAEAKVASIGSVNPRPPGVLNSLIQSWKRLLSRMLDWHVREQVEFNRGVMASVEAILEALNENNRTLARLAQADAELAGRLGEGFARTSEDLRISLVDAERRMGERMEERLTGIETHARRLQEEAVELKDVRTHWAEWRQEWERKLSINEVQFLRGVADLQGAFQHRVTLLESNFREMVKSQHADFNGALDRSGLEIQKRLWEDLERVRATFEKLIHTELRLIRQRAAIAPAEPRALLDVPPAPLDYARFSERFRGSEDYVAEKQSFYLPLFENRNEVVDLGCGRGEFLQMLKDNGVPARGVDASAESVAVCRSRGLDAEAADLFAYLNAIPDLTLGGIFCAQVVEHLSPKRVGELVRLAASKLARNGLLVIETPNPECLAIFASHFYLDPTHTRPVPPALLRFYLEESGLGNIAVHPLSPAVDTMPALGSLPEDFRVAFFGGLDYAITGTKL